MRLAATVFGLAGGVVGAIISFLNLSVGFLGLPLGGSMFTLFLIDVGLFVFFLLALAASVLVLANSGTGRFMLAISTLGTAVLGYMQLPPYSRPFGPPMPEGLLEPTPFYVYSISAMPILLVATILAFLAARRVRRYISERQ